MSHRAGNKIGGGVSQQNESLLLLNNIAGINHVIMCRSCRWKTVCMSKVDCQIEKTFDFKSEMLIGKIGIENFRSLPVSTLIEEFSKITDAEVEAFVNKRKEEYLKSQESKLIPTGPTGPTGPMAKLPPCQVCGAKAWARLPERFGDKDTWKCEDCGNQWREEPELKETDPETTVKGQ